MKRYLIFKLLAINLLIIAFAMVMVWVAVDNLAAGYFVTLMEKYNISPEPAHEMFVSAIHRYLIWATFGAVVLAVILSYALTRWVLTPLTRMAALSQEIAAGNYEARVTVTTQDEVGRLAEAFNRMGESLLALESLRRDLMIDVAHELRTPLTNVRGYLEALQDGVLPPSKKTFSMLLDETIRLSSLVEDVLRLAKADAARGKLDETRVRLGDMIEVSLEFFAEAVSKKELSVGLQGSDEPIWVRVDRDRFFRVLRNLTENAVGYAPQGSTVEVRIGAGDGLLVTYVNDAPNLSEHDLPFMFERFYRGEKSRSRRHGGAGIGLSIVKELVEAHGGTVSADLAHGRVSVSVWLPQERILEPLGDAAAPLR